MPRTEPRIAVYRSDHVKGRESWRACISWPDARPPTWLRRPTEAAARSSAEAAVAEDAARKTPPVRTIEQCIQEYCELRMSSGCWAKATDKRNRIDLAELVAEPHQPIVSIDRQYMLGYLERTKHLALGSRKTRWGSVTQFLQFCVSEGWLERSPAELIDRARKPWSSKRAKRMLGRGKDQLRNSTEVQLYIDAALHLDQAEERVAVLLPLLCNMRSGEVLHLECGDVDLPLGVIHVRDKEAREDDDDGWSVKSVAGRRAVYIPELLKSDLELLSVGHPSNRLLIGFWSRGRGERRHRIAHKGTWLADLVERVCVSAGTRIVKPHGLRGTYMTVLAVVGKVAPMDIARLVGHADGGQTAKRHYLGGVAPEPALPLGAARPVPADQRASGGADSIGAVSANYGESDTKPRAKEAKS